MNHTLKLLPATAADISELYRLQLLAFESEAEMIGSRAVPALMETAEHSRADFPNWTVWKILSPEGAIVAAIRCRRDGDMMEIGRLMVHPDYRRQGLAQRMLAEVDKAFPDIPKELYTCTKSWINIRLYEKTGFTPVKEVTEESGLTFVYMRKT